VDDIQHQIYSRSRFQPRLWYLLRNNQGVRAFRGAKEVETEMGAAWRRSQQRIAPPRDSAFTKLNGPGLSEHPDCGSAACGPVRHRSHSRAMATRAPRLAKEIIPAFAANGTAIAREPRLAK
jgi:hypothetical protein